ncbi:hypothetical protein OVY35_24290, partial [Salmonella enterica subsp. enterica serovar 1,4,[5],12:i:-]|nr:hypothetical protein [Salmonella enterica subsp. enterica serovar 1,4,[5],12:i:-]
VGAIFATCEPETCFTSDSDVAIDLSLSSILSLPFFERTSFRKKLVFLAREVAPRAFSWILHNRGNSFGNLSFFPSSYRDSKIRQVVNSLGFTPLYSLPYCSCFGSLALAI